MCNYIYILSTWQYLYVHWQRNIFRKRRTKRRNHSFLKLTFVAWEIVIYRHSPRIKRSSQHRSRVRSEKTEATFNIIKPATEFIILLALLRGNRVNRAKSILAIFPIRKFQRLPSCCCSKQLLLCLVLLLRSAWNHTLGESNLWRTRLSPSVNLWGLLSSPSNIFPRRIC